VVRVSSPLELIGNTPLVEVSALSPNPEVRILVKLEGQNPGRVGEGPDRAVNGGRGRERRSAHPGRHLLEPSSGNTGIGLALVCRVKGYHLKVVLPSNVSVERRQLLSRVGSRDHRVTRLRRLERSGAHGRAGPREHPEWVYLYQYANRANPGRTTTTGPEIWRDCPEITHFVAGLGTSGTLSGWVGS
jgi:cysteine synthase